MASQAEIQQRIDDINLKIDSGVSTTSTDGTSVTLDLKVLTEQRDRLVAELSISKGTRPKSGTMRVW